MAARFAGSHRLDERRRRRLAQETLDASVDDGSADRPSPRRRRLDAAEVRPARRQVLLPLPVFIPSRTWKLVAQLLLALLPGILGLSFADRVPEWSSRVGPGLQRLVQGSPTPLFLWYEGLLLLGAAHLAMVICWVRSRSNHDYSGRYWIWARVALACGLFASARATGLHLAFSETCDYLYPTRIWQRDTLFWMVPSGLAGGLLLTRLRLEMRQVRGAWACLVVGALAYWLAGLACLDVLPPLAGVTTARILDSALLAGHGSILMGLLLHARHVVHCTAEPAPLPEPTRRLPRPHFPFLFRRAGAEIDEPETDAKSRRSPAKSKPRKKKKPTKKPTESLIADASDLDSTETEVSEPDSTESEGTSGYGVEEAAPVPSDDEADAADEAELPSPGPSRGGSGHNRREPEPVPQRAPLFKYSQPVDESPDEDHDDGDDSGENSDLSGLSRKQRRKLAKQQRQRGR